MTGRHRTEAERDAAQARHDAWVAAETDRRRAAAARLIESETADQRAKRAAEAYAKYGGAA